MKVHPERKIENGQRILEVASHMFRERGFEAVSVAEVMQAAGMTHGGFYGHFQSKDDLIARAIGHAIDSRKGIALDLRGVLDEYLSPQHRDNSSNGCPIAALAAETVRQAPEARSIVTEGVRAQIDWLFENLPAADDAERRRQAVANCAALVGATILARATTDPLLSDEILKETRAWINDDLDRTATAPFPQNDS